MLGKSLADAMAQQTLDSQDHIEEVTPEAIIEPVSENVDNVTAEQTTSEINDDSEQQTSNSPPPPPPTTATTDTNEETEKSNE